MIPALMDNQRGKNNLIEIKFTNKNMLSCIIHILSTIIVLLFINKLW